MSGFAAGAASAGAGEFSGDEETSTG